ncbi:hypothetical protein ACWC9H_27225 [Streptomyces sp. NPDC001251]
MTTTTPGARLVFDGFPPVELLSASLEGPRPGEAGTVTLGGWIEDASAVPAGIGLCLLRAECDGDALGVYRVSVDVSGHGGRHSWVSVQWAAGAELAPAPAGVTGPSAVARLLRADLARRPVLDLAGELARWAAAMGDGWGTHEAADRLAQAGGELMRRYRHRHPHPVRRPDTRPSPAIDLMHHVEDRNGFLALTAGEARGRLDGYAAEFADPTTALASLCLSVLPDPLPVDDQRPVILYNSLTPLAGLLASALDRAPDLDDCIAHLPQLLDGDVQGAPLR